MSSSRGFFEIDILPQPSDWTCGPTCLQAVYRYFGDAVDLEQVVEEIPMLAHGGTLGVMLGCHALRRGYRATLYTYDLKTLDPTWLARGAGPLGPRLRAQAAAKPDPKLHQASHAYLEFLELGGRVRMVDLTPGLLRRPLRRRIPVLTGLSATYLYREKRELDDGTEDDVRGEPVGHFVVLTGYDPVRRRIHVADPQPNPLAPTGTYPVDIDRVVASILLGVLTYDANLLVLEPKRTARR